MTKAHPIDEFRSPSTITKGEPLKNLFDSGAVKLIGESFATTSRDFELKRFVRRATEGLDELEMKPRASHIAEALIAELPRDANKCSEILIRALGPKLSDTSDNGLAGFFYMPHSFVVRRALLSDFDSGMRANYELTQRFTAEFSIRPFIERYQKKSIALLQKWCGDSNPHVRRLVSEGTRPRLPWAERLPAFVDDPSPVLPLLETLRDDPELYVRRSVANHLGDIAKDHLSMVVELCRRWLEESESLGNEIGEARRWLVRHALRHPTKKGDKTAIEVRKAAGWKPRN